MKHDWLFDTLLCLICLGVIGVDAQTTTRTATQTYRGVDQVVKTNTDGGAYRATFSGTPVLILVFRNGVKLTQGIDYNATLATGVVTISPLQAWSATDLVTVSVISSQG